MPFSRETSDVARNDNATYYESILERILVVRGFVHLPYGKKWYSCCRGLEPQKQDQTKAYEKAHKQNNFSLLSQIEKSKPEKEKKTECNCLKLRLSSLLSVPLPDKMVTSLPTISLDLVVSLRCV